MTSVQKQRLLEKEEAVEYERHYGQSHPHSHQSSVQRQLY